MHTVAQESSESSISRIPIESRIPSILRKLYECQTVVLLLSKHTLFRPECLYVIYRAIVDDKLLIPVFLDRGGYDYTAAAELLESLEEKLLQHHPYTLRMLDHYFEVLHQDSTSHTIAHLQHTLRAALPNLIAISWQPTQGRNHTSAVVSDILARMSSWEQCHAERSVITQKVKDMLFKETSLTKVVSAESSRCLATSLSVTSLRGRNSFPEKSEPSRSEPDAETNLASTSWAPCEGESTKGGSHRARSAPHSPMVFAANLGRITRIQALTHVRLTCCACRTFEIFTKCLRSFHEALLGPKVRQKHFNSHN